MLIYSIFAHALDYIAGSERIVYSKKKLFFNKSNEILRMQIEAYTCCDDVEFGPTMVENLYSYSIVNDFRMGHCNLFMG